MSERLFDCSVCGKPVAESAFVCPHCGSQNFRPASYYEEQKAQVEADLTQKFGKLIEVFADGEITDDYLGKPRITNPISGFAFWIYMEKPGGKGIALPLGWKKNPGDSFYRGFADSLYDVNTTTGRLKLGRGPKLPTTIYQKYDAFKGVRLKPGTYELIFESYEIDYGHHEYSLGKFTILSSTKQIRIHIRHTFGRSMKADIQVI